MLEEKSKNLKHLNILYLNITHHMRLQCTNSNSKVAWVLEIQIPTEELFIIFNMTNIVIYNFTVVF